MGLEGNSIDIRGTIIFILSLIYLFSEEVRLAALKNREALKIRPEDILIQAHRGHIYLFQGNWKMAQHAYLENAQSTKEETNQKVALTLLEELQAFKKAKIKHPLLAKAIRLLQKEN